MKDLGDLAGKLRAEPNSGQLLALAQNARSQAMSLGTVEAYSEGKGYLAHVEDEWRKLNDLLGDIVRESAQHMKLLDTLVS